MELSLIKDPINMHVHVKEEGKHLLQKKHDIILGIMKSHSQWSFLTPLLQTHSWTI